MTNKIIRFYFGLGSRYSYLAATQLERIETQHDCKFEWIPIQSGELIKQTNDGNSPFHKDNVSGQYNWEYRQKDAEAWAELYQVAYKEPVFYRIDPADLAKACWFAAKHDKLKQMAWQIFNAIFVHTQIIGKDELGTLATEIGLIGAEMITSLNDQGIIADHQQAIDQAIEDGAFGVPTFIFNDQLFWGNDRLQLLEHKLLHNRP